MFLQKQDHIKAAATTIIFTNLAEETTLIIIAAMSIGKIQYPNRHKLWK
jgi:hypothetical protein